MNWNLFSFGIPSFEQKEKEERKNNKEPNLSVCSMILNVLLYNSVAW